MNRPTTEPHPSERCSSYAGGHKLHWIAAMRRGQDTDGWTAATINSVTRDGWIEIDVDGEAVRLWNHDVRTLRPGRGTPCRWEGSLLKVSGRLISVSTSAMPCFGIHCELCGEFTTVELAARDGLRTCEEHFWISEEAEDFGLIRPRLFAWRGGAPLRRVAASRYLANPHSDAGYRQVYDRWRQIVEGPDDEEGTR